MFVTMLNSCFLVLSTLLDLKHKTFQDVANLLWCDIDSYVGYIICFHLKEARRLARRKLIQFLQHNMSMFLVKKSGN